MVRIGIVGMLAWGCGGGGVIDVKDTGSPTDTETTSDPSPSVVVTVEGLPDPVLSGQPWSGVVVRTVPPYDGTLVLTGSGDAALTGVLELEAVDGVATFDGLTASGCGALSVSASAGVDASGPSTVEVTSSWSVAQSLPLTTEVGSTHEVVAQQVDFHGSPLEGDTELVVSPEAGLTVAEATLSAGEARITVEVGAVGDAAIELRGEGSCTVTPAVVGPVRAGETIQSQPVFLPAARVGSEWGAAIPDWPVDALVGATPSWLDVDPATGWAMGVPEAEGPVDVEIVGWLGDDLDRRVVRFGVFDADDAQEPPPDQPSEPGPHAVDSTLLAIPSITSTAGTFAEVPLLVTYPSDGAGGVAEGTFPLVAFHHAAHYPADIFDHYTALHEHWASHGIVVASVDSQVNVSGVSQSWDNLSNMSTFQRAAVDHMLEESATAASMFAGRVDGDRLVVSGHSRGGGASLISLWEDPRLLGAICFEQVSPLQTPDQDFGDPTGNGDRPLPAKPILFFAGAEDRDEPWPLVDTAFGQATGPAAFVTLLGANHEDTYDEDTPGGTTSTSDIPIEDRHDLDQHYSTAFLARFAFDDLAHDASLFGADGLSSDLSALGVVVHGRRYMASTVWVDDFEEEDPSVSLLGGAVTADGLAANDNGHPFTAGLAAAGRGDERADYIGAWTGARHLSWSDASPWLTFATTPDGSGLDLSGQQRLLLRVHQECDPPGGWSDPGCPTVRTTVAVILRDAAGFEAEVDLDEGLGANGLVGRHDSGAILELHDFAGVDLGAVTAIELRFDATSPADGDLWLDDLRIE